MYQVKIEDTVTPRGRQVILAAWKNNGQYMVNCNPFYTTINFLSRTEAINQPSTTYGYEF